MFHRKLEAESNQMIDREINKVWNIIIKCQFRVSIGGNGDHPAEHDDGS